MDADLDLLCVSVYVTADDLLPGRPAKARRKLTDAEIVTLCVAQVLMGIPSDRRFLRAARRQLGHVEARVVGAGASALRGGELPVQALDSHRPGHSLKVVARHSP